jgi:hypothetical protein
MDDAADRPVRTAGQFAVWLLDAFNHAAFCLMASIGHRCGLFDVMARLPPSTTDESPRWRV